MYIITHYLSCYVNVISCNIMKYLNSSLEVRLWGASQFGWGSSTLDHFKPFQIDTFETFTSNPGAPAIAAGKLCGRWTEAVAVVPNARQSEIDRIQNCPTNHALPVFAQRYLSVQHPIAMTNSSNLEDAKTAPRKRSPWGLTASYRSRWIGLSMRFRLSF